jgi:hypothetical protein
MHWDSGIGTLFELQRHDWHIKARNVCAAPILHRLLVVWRISPR